MISAPLRKSKHDLDASALTAELRAADFPLWGKEKLMASEALIVVDLQNDFSIKEFGGHQMTVATMTLFDGDLITGSFDGEIRIWPRIHEDNPGEKTRTFERSIALSPEGFDSQ